MGPFLLPSRVFCVALLAILLAKPGTAATFFWMGTVNSSWDEPNNWSPVGVPDGNLGDDVRIIGPLGPGAPAPVVNVTTASCRHLLIDFVDLEVAIGMQLDIQGNLQFVNATNITLQPNSRLKLQGNLDNASGNGNLISQPGSRVVLYGTQNTKILGDITFYDITISKTPPYYVFNAPLCSGIPTFVTIDNNLTIDLGVYRVCDADNGQTQPELSVNGNIIINNGGGLDLSGREDFAQGCAVDADGYNSEEIRVHLGGNLSDNSSPYDPTPSRGFYIGDLTINSATHAGERALLVFVGARDQTVLGQYTLTDEGNVPNQGAGIWMPRIRIDKSNPAKRVAMLTNMRIYGNSEIRSGVLLTNGKRLLFGERNDETLDITNSGTLYANENSEIRLLGQNANGVFLRVYSGGHLKMIGGPAERIIVTRDAATPGRYFRTAVYNGGRISARYVDFNFQGSSNTGFNNNGLLGSTCNCQDPADPCYSSLGGFKVFQGAVLDPDGLGANFSDCAFSAGANAYTGLLLNVTGNHILQNVVFNGSNQDASIPHIFGRPPAATCDDFVNPTDQCLCRGTVTPTNIISNNPNTTITLVNGSGMIGGDIIGEYFDAGNRDYVQTYLNPAYAASASNQAWGYHENNSNRLSYVNDFVVHTGRGIAVWIGRSATSDNWNDIDNWSTKTLPGSPIPGVGGADTFTVIIPRGARRNPVVNVPVSLRGSIHNNLTTWVIPTVYLNNSLGIYPATTTYTQSTTNKILTVNAGMRLSFEGDLFNYASSTLTMTGASELYVGGSYFNHSANAQFNRANSTVYFNGAGPQQVRTGDDEFWNVTIIKPSSTVYIQNNSLTIRNNFLHQSGAMELFTGQQLRVHGNFTMNGGRQIWNFSPLFFRGNFVINDGELMPQGSSVQFEHTVAGTYRFKTNNQAFNYLRIGGVAGCVFTLEDNLTILSSHKGVAPAFIGTTYNHAWLAAGNTLNLNGNQMRVQHFVVDGTLNVTPGSGPRGAELLIEGLDNANTTGDGTYTYPTAGTVADNSLRVRTGGRLNVIGTAAKTSKVSRQGINGRYRLEVEAGASISAEQALFDLMDANGIDCRLATIVTPASGNACFSHTTFTNGAPTAGSILLRIPKRWDPVEKTVQQANFPARAHGSAINVWRDVSGAGPNTTITFNLPSGIFAGEDFDDDNGQAITYVDWVITNIKRWDGGGDGISWNDANNWCDNTVPGPTDDVILDHTACSPLAAYTITASAPVAIKDLYIIPDNQLAAGTVNPIVLRVNANFTVNGQFTCDALGTFHIQNSTSTLTFRRSFSLDGEFYHGNNPNLNFDGTGINVINNSGYADYPFYTMNFLNGIYELNSIIQVQNDVTIQSTGVLDASNDNFRINLAGNWTNNNGNFEPRFGTVAFVDLDAHTEALGGSTVSYPAVASAQSIRYTNGYTTFADSLANLVRVPETFFNLVIDKHLSPVGQDVKSRATLLVNGVLDLRQRNLNTQCTSCPVPGISKQQYENLAILGLFGSWTNASEVSYIDGPLARTYISNVPFNYDFPIGKTGDYVKPMELEIALATNGPELALFAVEQFSLAIDTLNRPIPPSTCAAVASNTSPVLLNRSWNVAQVRPSLWGSPTLASGNVKLVWGAADGIPNTYEGMSALKDNGPDPRGLSAKHAGLLDDYDPSCTPAEALVNGNELGGEILSLSSFSSLGNGDFGVVYHNVTLLPIEEISFEASYAHPGAQLGWLTRNEYGNAGFELQRAEVGHGFETIAHYTADATLVGRGTYLGNSQYHYYDAARLLPGHTYTYRLYSEDLQGNRHLDGERSITVPRSSYLDNVFPNPFSQQLTLRYGLTQAAPVTVRIYNAQGVLAIQPLRQAAMPASNHSLTIDTSQLESGVYILHLITPDEAHSQRLIKQ